MAVIDLNRLLFLQSKTADQPQFGRHNNQNASVSMPHNHLAVVASSNFEGIRRTTFDTYWDAVSTWFWFYYGQGHSRANTRLQFRNLEAAILRSNNTWERVFYSNTVGLNSQCQMWFGTITTHDAPTGHRPGHVQGDTYNRNLRQEPADKGGGCSIKLTTPDMGAEVWANDFFMFIDRAKCVDMRCLIASIEARVINEDGTPYTGADAVYTCQLGSDQQYHSTGNGSDAPGTPSSWWGRHGSSNPGNWLVGYPRFMMDASCSAMTRMTGADGWVSFGLVGGWEGTHDTVNGVGAPYAWGDWKTPAWPFNKPPYTVTRSFLEQNRPAFVTFNGVPGTNTGGSVPAPAPPPAGPAPSPPPPAPAPAPSPSAALNVLVSGMGPNDGQPHAYGSGQSLYFKGDWVMGTLPHGDALPDWYPYHRGSRDWADALPWYDLQHQKGSRPSTNAGVIVRNMRSYVRSNDGQGWKLFSRVGVNSIIGSDFFYDGYAGAGFNRPAGPYAQVLDGGSAFRYGEGQGSWLHGYGNVVNLKQFLGGNVRNCTGLLNIVEARLHSFDGQPITGAKLLFAAGCDYYPDGDIFGDVYNPGAGCSRHAELTNQWKTLCFWAFGPFNGGSGSRDEAGFRASNPPLADVVVAGQSTTPSPPPPPPPPPAQNQGGALGNITPIGDSLFSGHVLGDYDAPWLRLSQLLTAGGYTYNFVGTRPNTHDGQPGDIPISSAGGWTVRDAVNDLPAVVALQPKTLIVSLGTNHLEYHVDELIPYLNNLVLATAGVANRRIFACMPVKIWLNDVQYADVRQKLVVWCAAAANRHFVDLNAAGLSGADFVDGTHWSTAGANKIAQHIYNAIVAVFGSSTPTGEVILSLPTISGSSLIGSELTRGIGVYGPGWEPIAGEWKHYTSPSFKTTFSQSATASTFGLPSGSYIEYNETITNGSDTQVATSVAFGPMTATVTPTPPPPPAPPGPGPSPPPPSVPTGPRKELWFGLNNSTSQSGTFADPIMSFDRLKLAIAQYGSQGLDLRLKPGSSYSGKFPTEVFNYNNVRISGSNWLSEPGYFEGGVRMQGWTTASGAPGGKQLWIRSGLGWQAFTASFTGGEMQHGAVSINDMVIAHITNTPSTSDLYARMAAFLYSYSYSVSSNTLILMLPTGMDPNVEQTYVAYYSNAFSTGPLADARTGVELFDLRFKRYSGSAISLANLPGVRIYRIYGRNIGGRYYQYGTDGSVTEGSMIQLIGGCHNFDIRNVKAEGVQDSVVRVVPYFGSQNNGYIASIDGTDVGLSVVQADLEANQTGRTMDNLMIEDVTGNFIGNFTAAGLRPHPTRPAKAGVRVVAYSGATNSTFNNLRIRRVTVRDSTILHYQNDTPAPVNAPAQVLIVEGCDGLVSVPATLVGMFIGAAGSSTTGGLVSYITACGFEGYREGVSNIGGAAHLSQFRILNNTFRNVDIAFQARSKSLAYSNFTNNVFHNVTYVASGHLPGTAISEGSNYLVTGVAWNSGSEPAVLASFADATGAAPTYASGSPAYHLMFASGSALYSGGVSQSALWYDRLQQQYTATWARGSYAAFKAYSTPPAPPPPPPFTPNPPPPPPPPPGTPTPPPPGTPPPPPPGPGPAPVPVPGPPPPPPPVINKPGLVPYWSATTNLAGDKLFLAESIGDGFITGMTVFPLSFDLVIGSRQRLAIAVTGTSDADLSVTVEQLSGQQFAALEVTLNPSEELDYYIRANSIGLATFRVRSIQAPAIYQDVAVTVKNASQGTLTADPPGLIMTLSGGPKTFIVKANGKPAARLALTSEHPLIARVTAQPKPVFDDDVAQAYSGFDGKVTVTPAKIGATSIVVTQVQALTGGTAVLRVPVFVTASVMSGVTSIHAVVADGVVDDPFVIQLVDQNGVDMPAWPPVEVSVSLPGYVTAPSSVVNGKLPVLPVSVGTAYLTLTFEDPINGRISNVIAVKVGAAVAPTPDSPDVPATDNHNNFIFEIVLIEAP